MRMRGIKFFDECKLFLTDVVSLIKSIFQEMKGIVKSQEIVKNYKPVENPQTFSTICNITNMTSPWNDQKQTSRGVHWKMCSKNMQQIYRRTPMTKCNFNKVAEAPAGGVLYKKVFLKISQKLQENTCARVSFLIKLQA